MKKYELKKSGAEVKKGKEASMVEGFSTSLDGDPNVLGAWPTKEEALNELKKYNTEVKLFDRYYLVSEYYVEENEYDEDNEWIGGGNIFGVSKMKIEVEDLNGNIQGTYSDIMDAMEKLDGMEEGGLLRFVYEQKVTVRELRRKYKMSQQKFGDYFGIPLRTVQNWEYGISDCSQYIIDLMVYKLKHEMNV